jgi:universal stress protein A
MSPFRKILVATDFSPHAAHALRLAVQLAKTCDAALQLVHVYDMIPYALPDGMPVYDDGQLGRLREELGKQLSKAQSAAREAGIQKVDTTLLQGQASAQIVQAAQEADCDLIVTGTHGRSGFAHLLLGSVAERVVRHAPCPVLTVPLKEEGKR